MVDTAEASYPAALQQADQQRGRLDGQQHLPSLAEVRRRQRELAGTDGQLSVGYQTVLLAELRQQLQELKISYDQRNRAAAIELARCAEQIRQAGDELRRTERRRQLAAVLVTAEELLPRNSEEEHWDARTLRNRREVTRSRRLAWAEESVDEARSLLQQRQRERTAAIRQQQAVAADPGVRARRLIELYRRRLAEYLSALAQHHPEGRTLYPLLSIPETPLPEWAAEVPALAVEDSDLVDAETPLDSETPFDAEIPVEVETPFDAEIPFDPEILDLADAGSPTSPDCAGSTSPDCAGPTSPDCAGSTSPDCAGQS